MIAAVWCRVRMLFRRFTKQEVLDGHDWVVDTGSRYITCKTCGIVYDTREGTFL